MNDCGPELRFARMLNCGRWLKVKSTMRGAHRWTVDGERNKEMSESELYAA